MFFKLDSIALLGIDCLKISIEIHISSGLPSFTVVGLPDKAVNESRMRVRAAIINSGFKFPLKRIIINLSPADIKKEGPCYDFPIAFALLAASSQVICSNTDLLNKCLFIGELSLDGGLNPVRGIISMVEFASDCRKEFFFIPEPNFSQALIANRVTKEVIKIISCSNLKYATGLIASRQVLLKKADEDCKMIKIKAASSASKINTCSNYTDFNIIKGQLRAKRALEIAAAGMHNILLVGPPGAGKTLLAQSIISILPELSEDESLEVTKIYSLLKNIKGDVITTRPFRNPHHTITSAGLSGGGAIPKPGEISLAHRGVLFLDEFSQFPGVLIENLRQPLENKEIIIVRNNYSYRFPASFMLILATNPCMCGYNGDKKKDCKCSPREVIKYWKKISGPIIDRIDMRVNVERLEAKDFMAINYAAENSCEIKIRVNTAHNIQKERYLNALGNIHYNSEVNAEIVNRWESENNGLSGLIPEMVRRFNFSARAIASLIKVARTIADLDRSKDIIQEHFMESLNFRIDFAYE
jgi:magnesium chelatase family protein